MLFPLLKVFFHISYTFIAITHYSLTGVLLFSLATAIDTIFSLLSYEILRPIYHFGVIGQSAFYST